MKQTLCIVNIIQKAIIPELINRKMKKNIHHIWEEFKRDGMVNNEVDEYYSSGEGLATFHPIKNYRIYLQKNCRCFKIQSLKFKF